MVEEEWKDVETYSILIMTGIDPKGKKVNIQGRMDIVGPGYDYKRLRVQYDETQKFSVQGACIRAIEPI